MVDIMNEVPQTPEQKEAAKQKAVEDSMDRIKHKFLIMSGKGGVGKSSTTVNLAMALANKGFKVGIIDVDLHGPDIPRMLGLTGFPRVNDDNKLIPMAYNDNLKVISIESLMPNKDEAVIWRGPVKFAAIRQFLGEVEWGELDYLLIDAPPGTGDEPLTIAQQILDARAIVVTTPQEVALADVRKSINFCHVVKLGIFGMIENMSGYTCPHCNETVDLFGAGGGEKTAEEMGIHFLGRIPFDPRMVVCGDNGKCMQNEDKDAPVSKAFAAIADRMAQLA